MRYYEILDFSNIEYHIVFLKKNNVLDCTKLEYYEILDFSNIEYHIIFFFNYTNSKSIVPR